jgi:hypothetical protein
LMTRLADELVRIGVEGRASVRAEFAASSRHRVRSKALNLVDAFSIRDRLLVVPLD